MSHNKPTKLGARWKEKKVQEGEHKVTKEVDTRVRWKRLSQRDLTEEPVGMEVIKAKGTPSERGERRRAARADRRTGSHGS